MAWTPDRLKTEGYKHQYAWKAKNRDKVLEIRRKAYKKNHAKMLARAKAKRETDKYKNDMLLLKYGITTEQRSKMLSEQDGKCALCLRPESDAGKRGLAVDHSHDETGTVRGLLCFTCNTALAKVEIGLLDEDWIKRARKYLANADKAAN